MRDGKISKVVLAKICGAAVYDKYGKQAESLMNAAHERIREFVEDAHAGFDWERMETYRDYIHLIHELDVRWRMPCEWNSRDVDEVRRLLKIDSCFCVPLSKDYPVTTFGRLRNESDVKATAIDALRPLAELVFRAKKLHEELLHALKAAPTYRKFEEIFPGLVKYIPDEVVSEGALVPVEQINAINALFKSEGEAPV